jgi:hypothetical protein
VPAGLHTLLTSARVVRVACCLELAPAAGKEKVIADWVHDLRARYSRFSAFQEELKNALASISDRL